MSYDVQFRKCKSCRESFVYHGDGSRLCPDCRDPEDETLDLVDHMKLPYGERLKGY